MQNEAITMASTSTVEDVRSRNCKSFDRSLELFKSLASQRTEEIYEKSTSSANNLKNRGTTSKNRKRSINKQPYWVKSVQMTPDLILRYQLPQRKLEDVLASDLKTLEIFKKDNQSSMVNEQLEQLYLDISAKKDENSRRMSVGNSSGGSEGEEDNLEFGEEI